MDFRGRGRDAPRHLAALAVALAPALAAFPAAAQGQPPPSSTSSGPDGGVSADDELRSLEVAIDQEQERLTLAAGDCTTACSALASMRRAAERICALDPGPRCSAARGKVDAAASRVRGSCSDCAALREGAEPPAPAAARPAPLERESAATAEPGAGGCAGCATGGGQVAGLGALAVAALLAALRRRKPIRR